MDPSLTVFDVTCRCTGVPSNVPCAHVSVQLCLVWVPRPGYCAPESNHPTPVHVNPSWRVFEVICPCTGVTLNDPCARMSVLLCLVLVSWLGNRGDSAPESASMATVHGFGDSCRFGVEIVYICIVEQMAGKVESMICDIVFY